MDGGTINALQDENDMDIVLLERDEKVDVHPSGEMPVRAGDTLVIFCSLYPDHADRGAQPPQHINFVRFVHITRRVGSNAASHP